MCYLDAAVVLMTCAALGIGTYYCISKFYSNKKSKEKLEDEVEN